MTKHNWDEIEEKDGFDNPKPGAYIAMITRVDDVEEKEYLRIEWDFAEGEYKGNNQETYDRAAFWPMVLYRSYKESALGFFKSFKTALENSNRGYAFDEDHLQDMVGRFVGVVLGEEGYINNNGDHKKRLYVAQTRSVEAIQKGEYTVPAYREKDGQKGQKANSQTNSGWGNYSAPPASGDSFTYNPNGPMPWDN